MIQQRPAVFMTGLYNKFRENRMAVSDSKLSELFDKISGNLSRKLSMSDFV